MLATSKARECSKVSRGIADRPVASCAPIGVAEASSLWTGCRAARRRRDGAILFLQLINARHERASTVLTSNKGFEEWGSLLGDEVMAVALIDYCLLYHGHIVSIRGNSDRMRAHQDLLRSCVDEDGTRAGAA